MKYLTKLKLASVMLLCKAKEKSEYFTLQVMSDSTTVPIDVCVDFYNNTSKKELNLLYNDVMSFTKVISNLEHIN